MKNKEYLIENGIDVDAGIELLGDIETYNETLKDFLIECDERIPNIKKYKEENDMENYAILVHALKGDSKYLGFTKLAELALDHQLHSQENDINYVNENYETLMNEAERIIKVVTEYLK